MSLTRLWLVLAIGLPVLASVIGALSTVDLAYQLRAGDEILATGAVPTVDTWTFTIAGQPWVDQQWLAQVLLAGTYDLGGWTGLVLVRAALTAVLFGAFVATLRRAGLSARTTALVAVIAFAIAAPAMALRPQLFGMACFGIVLWLVATRHDHPTRVWLVPLVVAVWANLHGSFFLGPGIAGLAWLADLHDRRERPHRLLVVAAVAAVAACLTPFGPGVWTYAVGLSTNAGVTERVSEWQPTNLGDIAGVLFYVSALALAVLIALRGQRVPWPTLLWLGAFFVLGAYALRGVAWWPFAAAVAAAGTIIPPSPDPTGADPPAMRRINAIVATALALVGIALLPAWRPLDPGTGTPIATLTDAPSGVTVAVRDASIPGDHLLVPQTWGSWFEWALPDRLVAVDSRTELFPPETWDDVDAVAAGQGDWQGQLAAWGVDLVVTDEDQVDFADRLVSVGWRELYRDEEGGVFAPPTPR